MLTESLISVMERDGPDRKQAAGLCRPPAGVCFCTKAWFHIWHTCPYPFPEPHTLLAGHRAAEAFVRTGPGGGWLAVVAGSTPCWVLLQHSLVVRGDCSSSEVVHVSSGLSVVLKLLVAHVFANLRQGTD